MGACPKPLLRLRRGSNSLWLSTPQIMNGSGSRLSRRLVLSPSLLQFDFPLNFKYHNSLKRVASRWITMVNGDMFKWERYEGAPRASTTSTTVKMIVREDINCTLLLLQTGRWRHTASFFGLCSANWLIAFFTWPFHATFFKVLWSKFQTAITHSFLDIIYAWCIINANMGLFKIHVFGFQMRLLYFSRDLPNATKSLLTIIAHSISYRISSNFVDSLYTCNRCYYILTTQINLFEFPNFTPPARNPQMIKHTLNEQ